MTPGPRRWGTGDTRDACSVVQLTSVEDAVYPDWESAYTDNVRRLYRLMFSKVGNRPDAEDLTSEIFLNAVSGINSERSPQSVQSFILLIV